jgi:hypothetical protein
VVTLQVEFHGLTLSQSIEGFSDQRPGMEEEFLTEVRLTDDAH